VDTALMGRLSEMHIGAVGLGSMIFNFIYWNFGFLRMGTTGITAQYFGEKQPIQIMNTLARALFISLILAIFVMVLQVPFLKMSQGLLNVSGSQSQLLSEYFYIRIWAAPATLSLYALLGWFFGMQNAIYPLIITVSINLINILLSWYFVAHLELNVAGVAWGTVIAQYAGLMIAIILFWSSYKSYLSEFTRKSMLQLEELKKFLLINRDIFIRTVLLTFSFGFFYSVSSSQGSMILAANIILLQFLNWMSYGIDGFAYASESLIGKYYGQKNQNKLQEALKLSFVWAGVLAGIYSLVYWIFGVELIALFTNKLDVQTATLPFLIWVIILPIASFACYVWDGIYIGLTASKTMRNSMLIAIVIYMLAYQLLKPYGNNGLWLSLFIFLISRGIIQTLYYWKYKMNLK
jgi:MATE family multidrug resistance protein